MRLPVFQLSWTLRNHRMGLVFPSELSYETQDFAFFIPVLIDPYKACDEGLAYKSAIARDSYYFPCEIGGQYVEVSSEMNLNTKSGLPSLVFETSGDGAFEFLVEEKPFSAFDTDLYQPELDFPRYLGDFSKALFSRFAFLQLRPLDIKRMNSFYLEEKGILVGYTREFGNFPDNDLGNLSGRNGFQ
jgi:hypothetical protein